MKKNSFMLLILYILFVVADLTYAEENIHVGIGTYPVQTSLNDREERELEINTESEPVYFALNTFFPTEGVKEEIKRMDYDWTYDPTKLLCKELFRGPSRQLGCLPRTVGRSSVKISLIITHTDGSIEKIISDPIFIKTSAPESCPMDFKPVCAKIPGPDIYIVAHDLYQEFIVENFKNECFARRKRAYEIKEGTCKGDAKLPYAEFDTPVLTSFDVYENPFSDMEMSNDYGKSAAELYRREIIKGGTFNPEKLITRAEALKMLLRTKHPERIFQDEYYKYESIFSDVPNNAWYLEYVNFASQNLGISGDGKENFNPDTQISVAEFLSMMDKVFYMHSFTLDMFRSIPSDPWYLRYIEMSKYYSLFPIQNIEAAKKLSRKDVALAIFRYLNFKNNNPLNSIK